MNDTILVSICCETFNHENYIRDCLEGFISQIVDFKFEILIHDDASNDKTQEIIKEYCRKYPDIIKPILQTQNKYSQGICIWHEIQFPRANGKYIAICEGDDFWIDPYKLQKQVDFMESHPEYSMCATNANIVDSESLEIKGNYRKYNESKDISISELITGGGGHLATTTLFCKKNIVDRISGVINGQYVWDYPLQVMMGYEGKVRYLDFNSASYRLNSTGSWSNRILNADLEKRRETWKKHQVLIDRLDKATDYKYHIIFTDAMNEFLLSDYLKFHLYADARSLWWNSNKPLKKYGWNIFFKIYRLEFIYKLLKKLSK